MRTSILALLLLAAAASGQDETIDDIYELPETVVSATRADSPEATTPRFGTSVPEKEIIRRQPRTTPQALSQEVDVFIQETNLGGGSPFIRGMTGNQVLFLIDGIRINNSAFSRFGPNQYLNTVDQFLLADLEVVRGPNSLLYGSDALGGVVAMTSKSRASFEPGTHGNAETYLRFGSAALETTLSVRGEGNLGNWGGVAGAMFTNFDDLRGGRDTGVQTPTGYNAYAADLKVSYRIDEEHTLTLAYQLHNADDVPRTDRITSGRNLVYEFDPQRRQLGYLRWDAKMDGAFEEVHAALSYQVQEEGRTEVRSNAPDTIRVYDDKVDTAGLFAHATTNAGTHRITFGGDLYHDDVSSARTDYTNGVPEEKDGRFPDGATYLQGGVFVQDEWRANEDWRFLLGLRWSYFGWDATLDPPYEEFDGSDNAPTAQAGVSWRATDTLFPYFNFATGFRAPNLDDLTIFDSFGSGIEVPNPELESESSYNYELGLKLRSKGLRITFAGFYSDFDDLIQRVATGGTIEGEPEYTRENVGEARIYGIEFEGYWRIPQSQWSLSGNFAWLRGDNLTDDEPLRRIPPPFGFLGLRYDDVGGKFYTEIFSRFAARQDRLSQGDIDDPRIPEGGTPGWWTLNIRGAYHFSESFSIQAAIENLLDETYRTHGSGIDSPGTNVLITFVGTF
jgi:TonB-dependent heme/hemoglobin receptor